MKINYFSLQKYILKNKINMGTSRFPAPTLLEVLFVLSVFRTSIFSESGLPYAPVSEEQLIYATQNNWGLVFTHHVIYHM